MGVPEGGDAGDRRARHSGAAQRVAHTQLLPRAPVPGGADLPGLLHLPGCVPVRDHIPTYPCGVQPVPAGGPSSGSSPAQPVPQQGQARAAVPPHTHVRPHARGDVLPGLHGAAPDQYEPHLPLHPGPEHDKTVRTHVHAGDNRQAAVLLRPRRLRLAALADPPPPPLTDALHDLRDGHGLRYRALQRVLLPRGHAHRGRELRRQGTDHGTHPEQLLRIEDLRAEEVRLQQPLPTGLLRHH
mmetsp:Transcript_33650/g.74183  ORF Transcript_33650/g.74183 Transcript_33650/m.74183 type:complete len:241 (+) Transcript_33650:211-933(+)